MKPPEFYGQINKGKMTLDYQEKFTNYLTSLQYKDKPARIILTVKRWHKKRTSGQAYEKGNQNGYMFAVLLPPLCDHLGYFPLEMYHALEFCFCRTGGTDTLPKIKKFKEMDTKEWEEKMEQIRIWALTDFNINLPLPNEDLEREIFNN